MIDAAVLVSCPCDVEKWRAHMYEVQRWPGWLEKIDTVSPIDTVSLNNQPIGLQAGIVGARLHRCSLQSRYTSLSFSVCPRRADSGVASIPS